MDTEEKVEIIKSFAEEIITESELKHVFETNSRPIAYDGFEPSGIAPIHFGLLRATNLKQMLKTGVRFKLWLGDYFAFLNNKLDGNLENIQTAGKYFIEVWKACGIDTKKVQILWTSDAIGNSSYWDKVLRAAKHISLDRTIRATTIMGRKQGEKLSMGQLFYPVMQVSDIFHLEVDICQLGMDQRRANVLAREIAPKLKLKKPIAAHHHILLGLQGLQKKGATEETLTASKMSKSDPKSAIYMHETPDSLRKKINGAYCPAKQVEGNPILEYFRYIILKESKSVKIERDKKFGGDVVFRNHEELVKSYKEGKLHPADLKESAVKELDKLISPVRIYFEKNKKARQLYETVKKFQITK